MVTGLRAACAGAALVLFFGGVTGCRFFADYPMEKPPPDATLSETQASRDSHSAHDEAASVEAGPMAPCTDYPPGYAYGKLITIDRRLVHGTLVDFPALVVLDDPDLSRALDDGTDLQFFSLTGDRLDREIEVFDKGLLSPRLAAWVRLPRLSVDGTGTAFCLYFGNANPKSLGDGKEVWKNAFAGVFHFVKAPFRDSSRSAIATDGTDALSSAGRIGKALDLSDSPTSVLILKDKSARANAPFSLELWVKLQKEVSGKWLALLTKGRENNKEWFGLWGRPSGDKKTGSFATFGWTGSGAKPPKNEQGNLNAAERLKVGVWHHLVGTFENRTQRIYVDGELRATSKSNRTYADIPEPSRIGNDGFNSLHQYYFDGLIDEVRISTVARSGDWIWTQHRNQSDPRSFLSVGPLECADGAGGC